MAQKDIFPYMLIKQGVEVAVGTIVLACTGVFSR